MQAQSYSLSYLYKFSLSAFDFNLELWFTLMQGYNKTEELHISFMSCYFNVNHNFMSNLRKCLSRYEINLLLIFTSFTIYQTSYRIINSKVRDLGINTRKYYLIISNLNFLVDSLKYLNQLLFYWLTISSPAGKNRIYNHLCVGLNSKVSQHLFFTVLMKHFSSSLVQVLQVFVSHYRGQTKAMFGTAFK